MRANVYVTLKQEVLDPQGDAVRGALSSMGFTDVTSVRVGKLIELEVEASDKAGATAELEAMCKKLLANPVIEDYRFEVLD